MNDTDINDDDLTVAGARRAAERDELGEWVAAFLSSPGSDNADLAGILRDKTAYWFGPLKLDFDDLNRLAGPPDQPTLAPLPEEGVETAEDMKDSVEKGWEPPPLIVSYRNGQLVVEDGNHRIEGLRRAGARQYWSVVCIEDAAQRDEFLETVAR